MRKLLLLLACFCCLTSWSQVGTDRFIEGDLLQKDIEFLFQTIRETHQDPTFYCSQEDLDRAYAVAMQRVYTGMSWHNFLFLVSGVLQELKDSHTYLNYPYILNEIANAGGRTLPLTIHREDGKILVVEDGSKQIPAGSEIISINKTAAIQLLGNMNNLSVAEGDADLWKQRITESIYPILIGLTVPTSEGFDLELLLPDSSTSSVHLDGYIAEDGSNLIRRKNLEKFTVDGELGIITIPSFSRGKDRKYYRFLKKSFKKINKKKIEYLAIDLRDNTGGKSDRMEHLLHYLQLRPAHLPSNVIVKQSVWSKKRFEDSVNGWTRFVLKHFYKQNENVQNYLKMSQMELGTTDTLYYNAVTQSSKWRFKGSLFLLMNGKTASASANFAACFTLHQLGTIVGEECLGPLGGTWGNPVVVKLPHSGIEFHISTMRFNVSNDFSKDPTPVQPHYTVHRTQQSIVEGRDEGIIKIHELIKMDMRTSPTL